MFLKKRLEKRLISSIKNLSCKDQETYYHLKDNSNLKNTDIDANINNNNFKILSKDNKHKLNYTRNYKLFDNENINIQTKLAKEYIENIRDPDILELKPKKKWNISTRINYKDKLNSLEFKKTLFEVKNGLRDVNIVNLKDKRIELGTDSRNVYYVGWNNSNKITNKEKNIINNYNLDKAFRNTLRSWDKINNKPLEKTINSSKEEDLLKCNNNNLNDTNANTFNYKNPTLVVNEMNEIIRDFKKNNKSLNNSIKKQVEYDFPGATKEKITAIVYKKMNSHLKKEINKSLYKPWKNNTKLSQTFTKNIFSKKENEKENLFNKSKYNYFNKTSKGIYNSNSNNNSIKGNENRELQDIKNLSNINENNNFNNCNNNDKLFMNTLNNFGNITISSNFFKTPLDKFNNTQVKFKSNNNLLADNKLNGNKTVYKAIKDTAYNNYLNNINFNSTKSCFNKSNEAFFKNLPSSFNNKAPCLKNGKKNYYNINNWIYTEYYHTGIYVIHTQYYII